MTIFHIEEPLSSKEELLDSAGIEGNQIQFTMDVTLNELMLGIETLVDITEMNVIGEESGIYLESIDYAAVGAPDEQTVRLRVTAYLAEDSFE